MGCGSSREARPDDDLPAASVTPIPRANATGITSQTAINTPLSTTTSRHQSRLGPASASNLSTPRTSTGRRYHQTQTEESLRESYNLPLVAPKPWTSTDRSWSRSQLQRERNDFFETRVTGAPEIWGALKEVTELSRQGDIGGAQGILDAASITLPTGELKDGAYDERGMLYRLPEHIISDPQNMVDDDSETVVGEIEHKKLGLDTDIESLEEKEDKGKDALEKDAVRVKCRLSDRGTDCVVLLGKSQSVSVLIRRLRSEATISSSATVKMVYFGKILKENRTLEEQGWRDGHVVQALVSNFAL